MPEPSHDRRRRVLVSAAVAGVVALGAGLAIGIADDGDSDEPGSEPTSLQPPATTSAPDLDAVPDHVPEEHPADVPRGEPPPSPDELGVEEGPSGPPPHSDDERAAARAVRDYVNALTNRDGRAVCASFAPGALDEVDFPRERGGCAATVEASLGYERKGMPVWKSSETTPSISAKLDGDDARVTATVVTLYADQREPTIEDDIVFLQRAGDRWLIVKPDATLYRAIGDADVPLSAFTAP